MHVYAYVQVPTVTELSTVYHNVPDNLTTFLHTHTHTHTHTAESNKETIT